MLQNINTGIQNDFGNNLSIIFLFFYICSMKLSDVSLRFAFIFIILFQLSCNQKDLLLGKWKVVELTKGGTLFDEKKLGVYYFEFVNAEDLWITQKNESTRKKYKKAGKIIEDPETRSQLVIEKLDAKQLVLSGKAEDGTPFVLTMKKVEAT